MRVIPALACHLLCGSLQAFHRYQHATADQTRKCSLTGDQAKSERYTHLNLCPAAHVMAPDKSLTTMQSVALDASAHTLYRNITHCTYCVYAPPTVNVSPYRVGSSQHSPHQYMYAPIALFDQHCQQACLHRCA